MIGRKRRDRLDAAIVQRLSSRPGLSLNGYEICLLLGRRVGTIHAALERLENQGRITSRWVDGPYPRRRVYYIPEATP
jgi:DNA-binding PadR family transcriptional regulator